MLTACVNELPNPHRSCVRELLSALVCHENDYWRLNLELRNLQFAYKRELDKSVFECSQRRKIQCTSKERLEEFEREVGFIDQTNEYFKERIEDMKKKIKDELEASCKCYDMLQLEKRNLQKFHDKTINHLNSVIVNTDDFDVKTNSRKDIDRLSLKFVEETNFIIKCEKTLDVFLKILQDSHARNTCNFYFQEFNWIPRGKDTKIVDSIGDELITTMGPTLIKMFAQSHVYQATNPNTFMAAYVKNLEENEELIKAKLRLIDLHRH